MKGLDDHAGDSTLGPLSFLPPFLWPVYIGALGYTFWRAFSDLLGLVSAPPDSFTTGRKVLVMLGLLLTSLLAAGTRTQWPGFYGSTTLALGLATGWVGISTQWSAFPLANFLALAAAVALMVEGWDKVGAGLELRTRAREMAGRAEGLSK